MLSLCLAALLTYPAADLVIKDGDRIVMVGSTLLEREQQYGYIELMLHTMFPDKKFTVRNLGWSGDTVWGEARAGFGKPEDGYKKLIEQVKAEKPTVLILGYGTNEAFAGKAGVEKFVVQYRKLLNDIDAEKCQCIFLTIPKPLHPRLNPNYAMIEYEEAIMKVASERNASVFGIHELLYHLVPPVLSDDGLLPNDMGYQKLAQFFAVAFRTKESKRVDVQPSKTPEVPKMSQDNEPLRQLILQKNQLYFYKYRPQNDTYLFLFRKHEQGNNAKEIPQFGPLIAELDAKINEMKGKLIEKK